MSSYPKVTSPMELSTQRTWCSHSKGGCLLFLSTLTSRLWMRSSTSFMKVKNELHIGVLFARSRQLSRGLSFYRRVLRSRTRCFEYAIRNRSPHANTSRGTSIYLSGTRDGSRDASFVDSLRTARHLSG